MQPYEGTLKIHLRAENIQEATDAINKALESESIRLRAIKLTEGDLHF